MPAAPWYPLALLVLLGNMWGISFTLAKLAAINAVPPVAYAFYQALSAAVIVLGVCALRRRLPRLDRASLRYYLLAGGIGLALPNVNFVIVAQHVPAGVMALLINTVPIQTYLMALVLGMERGQTRRLLGVMLGFAGTLFIVVPDSALPDPSAAPFVLLGLITPFCYALNNVLLARLRPAGADSVALASGMMFGAAALLVPALFVFRVDYLPLPVTHWGDIALFGQIVVSSVAFIVFFELLRLRGPVFTGQVGYIVTAMGVIYGMIVFGERHGLWFVLAAACIVGGLVLVNWRGRGRDKPALSAPETPIAPSPAAGR